MESPLSVFFFIPNLIGYVRVALMLVAFHRMAEDYVCAVSCYLLSGFLDAIDGHAARYFKQNSKFGAMLDMLTDRAATMGLTVVLSGFYPAYTFYFQLSMCLDIVSHWIHMQSVLYQGKTSHKAIDLSGNPILRLYYTSRLLLFVMCAGNELFFASLYAMHFSLGPPLTPIEKGAQLIGVSFSAPPLWLAVFYASAPIAAVKALISLVHLLTASYNIAAIDCIERSEACQKRRTDKPSEHAGKTD